MKQIFFSIRLLITLCVVVYSVNAQQTYTVTNKTGTGVSNVSISTNDAATWILLNTPSLKIANEESFEFKQDIDKNNCIYDVMFTGDNGIAYIMQDIDLCASSSITLKSDSKIEQKTDINKNPKTEKKSGESSDIKTPKQNSDPSSEQAPDVKSDQTKEHKSSDQPTDIKPGQNTDIKAPEQKSEPTQEVTPESKPEQKRDIDKK